MANPTWGYSASGNAKIFDLEDGESLPSGGADSPGAWKQAEKAEKLAEKAVQNDGGLLQLIIDEKDKDALDQLADEQGIKLDKRKTFDRMLADYQARV